MWRADIAGDRRGTGIGRLRHGRSRPWRVGRSGPVARFRSSCRRGGGRAGAGRAAAHLRRVGLPRAGRPAVHFRSDQCRVVRVALRRTAGRRRMRGPASARTRAGIRVRPGARADVRPGDRAGDDAARCTATDQRRGAGAAVRRLSGWGRAGAGQSSHGGPNVCRRHSAGRAADRGGRHGQPVPLGGGWGGGCCSVSARVAHAGGVASPPRGYPVAVGESTC